MPRVYREDQSGPHRTAFDKNKKRIYASQSICGICGRPVDKTLRYPDPMAPCIDHIIPIARGGHPSDIDNLQLAHWACNRQKADKLAAEMGGNAAIPTVISNRNLPQSFDWRNYRG